MGLFTSINIAATGMSVERLRTDVISNNIANATTTRTQEGGAYRKQSVIVEPIASSNPQWRFPFVDSELDNGPGKGVRVREIIKDSEQGRMVYDPSHPDAIQSGPNKGYVEYPNVNIVNEMVNMISANRAYEANSSVIQGSKEMFASALEIASR
ncbi:MULTISPECIES: flagellar basal body rod protein FlgC [Treponema]|uniref:Flagellar basal-body rod protein FlgC n=1 Tax=Treponema succinifaciens (strain ATCC 33096 / DSM 2489 / 6091) TaxID=869209 RepID=F2NXF3_TRES6|nr:MULTISPECIES: flagellar basal body rod protein FlgC [Treponema]AEB14032.1 flagellar basal-body rod protein FlgC [Treponema succinifaciens DSM 2489]MCI6913784.1 flagellar basal body rod protein FlgC [Treponema succinifaciens]MDD6962584.1 flagellar basal body rod protein FlgC [Treponema succinifaciens]MDY2616946.1 flagellar basal body rod protein FlgC [Treponema succinifaciens]MDY5117224.1 flagellar basal body rod protein FlgC [Treponema succinifaciens]